MIEVSTICLVTIGSGLLVAQLLPGGDVQKNLWFGLFILGVALGLGGS